MRRFAAVTLGRMQAEPALPDLQLFSSVPAAPADDVDYACGWAIEQLTGEPVPDAVPSIRRAVNWYVEPLDK